MGIVIAYYPAKCVLSIIHVYAKRSLAEWNGIMTVSGPIPAVHTPLNASRELNLEIVEQQAQRCVETGAEDMWRNHR